jgi:hypothetical protein
VTTTTTQRRSPFNGYMKDVSEATSVASALTTAGLDFQVHKAPLYAMTPTANGVDQVEIEGKAGILRDTPEGFRSLGVASWGYGVIQNDEAFAPIDYLMREGFISGIAQAGAIGNGQRVFMLAELTSECRLSDPHQRMIMFATTHDGTGSFTVRGWMHRLFCSNQIPGIFSQRKSDWISKVAHTRNAQSYLAGVTGAVMTAIETLDMYDTLMADLQKVNVNTVQREMFLESLFPMRPELGGVLARSDAGARRARGVIEEKRNVTRRLIAGPNNEGLHGTAAALFQGAVEYSDHYARGNNAQRILKGTDVPFKLRALSLAKVM